MLPDVGLPPGVLNMIDDDIYDNEESLIDVVITLENLVQEFPDNDEYQNLLNWVYELYDLTYGSTTDEHDIDIPIEERVKVEEANLSQAMKFAFDYFVKPHDPKNILAYRPTNQKDKEWLRDNNTTGIIYLKKHPGAKAAWVLVKFEQKTRKKYGRHQVAKQSVKISTPDQFEAFFGVQPAPDFNFAEDMTINVKWDKELVTNQNANRDFDETTPNFYMYTNHLSVNLDRLGKWLYRINQIIETNPNAIIGDQFNIPYSATNLKL